MSPRPSTEKELYDAERSRIPPLLGWMSVEMDRRTLLAMAVASCGSFVLFAMAIGAAQAHGGRQVYAGEAGAYFVQVFVNDLAAEQGSLVDYTVSIRAAADRQPVNNARVTISAETPFGMVGPKEANVIENVHELLLPVKEAGQWTVLVSIDGPLGSTSLDHTMTPSVSTFTVATGEARTSRVVAVVTLAGVAFIVSCIAVDQLRRRRRRTPANLRS